MPLVQVEAVADEVLVRNDEADVPNRQVVDEPSVGAVEQGGDREGGGTAKGEHFAQVVQRQAGIDDVLDDEDVPILDRSVQVLQQPDPLVAARRGAPVAGELDEVEVVQ